MSERQNTLVCNFDMRSPRISAFHIHEWIFETLQLAEEDLSMIDGPKRQVYIKLNVMTDFKQYFVTSTDNMNISMKFQK
jgi:hypothetical protein